MSYKIIGVRPKESAYYFYITIAQDVNDKFQKMMLEARVGGIGFGGNRKIIDTIRRHGFNVEVDVIAETESSDLSYAIRNMLIYYCKSSVIFDGNHMTKLNYVSTGNKVKRNIKNGKIVVRKSMNCFEIL